MGVLISSVLRALNALIILRRRAAHRAVRAQTVRRP